MKTTNLTTMELPNGKKFYSFECGKYCVSYLDGADYYSIINSETRKEAHREVKGKRKKIQVIIKQMETFTTELKHIRPIVLDILN